jgi:hypothetical protein
MINIWGCGVFLCAFDLRIISKVVEEQQPCFFFPPFDLKKSHLRWIRMGAMLLLE